MSHSFKVIETFNVENNLLAINKFLLKTISKYPHLLVASEATAEYHRTLALTCLEFKIPFRLLNPIVTKQFTRSTIRKRKTDLTDAQIIAKLALTGEGSLVNERSFDTTKSYLRTADNIVHIETQLHLMQRRIITIDPDDNESFGSLELCISQLKSSVKVMREKTSLTT